MHDVVMLRDLRAGDVAEVGAKAASLGELIAAGIPVPDGFCLPISVYRRAVAPVLAERLALFTADGQLESSVRSLRDAVEAVELPATLLAGLAHAYRAVCPVGGSVAVRSSGSSEDSADASFAGQYHTELALGSFDEVVAAVKRCWASLWQAHAVAYRARRGIPHADAGMACIVQVMIEADAAGVMFTVDPRAGSPAADPVAGAEDRVAGAEDRVVIESSWGYGQAVVSGLVTPDRFSLSRGALQVQSAEVSRKLHMIGTANGGQASRGPTVTDVPPDRQTAASLTAAQASTLAGLGLAIEAHFGRPQDVEWAIAAGQIVILQARPVTHRSGTSAGADIRWDSPVDGARWARISICDSWLPEPLSPLFATTLFPELIKGWLQGWAGPEAATADNPLLPRPMQHTINGFAYLRIDYRLNKYPLRTVRLVLNFFRFYLGRLERRWRTVVLPRHVERLEAMRRLDLTGLDSDELLAMAAEASEISGRYWGLVGGLAWYWNVGEWLLARVYRRVTKRIARDGADVPGHGALLQGYPSKTYEAEAELFDLARSGDVSELALRFDDFLTRYGHQVYNLDFVEPTPAEDPSSFQAAVEAYRDGRAEDPRERLLALARRRDALYTQIATALRRSPVRRGVLQAVLRWNRRYGQLRDQVLFYFTLGWPVIRRAYLELGRRLVTAGALDGADDVFFLVRDELMAELLAIKRGGTLRMWAGPVRERRSRREAQKLLTPPEQVPPRSRVLLGKLDLTSLAFIRGLAKGDDESMLRGSAVSPGRVTGPARRVCTVGDFGKLKAGEVLIAPYLTPAWSPLLAIAGGVVTDVGGALSHGSIVAREYGIPAVMGTNNATKLIKDGQMVTIDGDRGLVY